VSVEEFVFVLLSSFLIVIVGLTPQSFMVLQLDRISTTDSKNNALMIY
jgi:hypothetical protein